MVSFRTTIHNHCIEIPVTQELPDGTEVMVQLVPVHVSMDSLEANWDDSPEGIVDWLNWLDSLEPLQLTDQERKVLEDDRQTRKQWEYEQFSGHADRLAKDWK